MTTAPGEELAAPGQKLQPPSPQPGTAGAAASQQQQQPRLAVVTLPGEIDIGNDGQVQDTLTSALDDGTAVLVADAGGTTFCGCSGRLRRRFLGRLWRRVAPGGRGLDQD